MLSVSTARLVGGAAKLGEQELLRIKGVELPVPAYRLLAMADEPRGAGHAESDLVGRRWEMSAVEGLLGRAIEGHGVVVGVAVRQASGRAVWCVRSLG